jgi:hypothetical protein
MPGPELQVQQALPKPWVIVDGRRLSVERADFATIPGRPARVDGDPPCGPHDRGHVMNWQRVPLRLLVAIWPSRAQIIQTTLVSRFD